jgi:hypothetical protein
MLKALLVLPVILFVDYILMALIGCATCLFGYGDEFYCGPYCIIGKTVLGFSAILFFYIISPNILKSKKNSKYAKTT